ncbi:MAG: DUF1926 domain-containing protein [Calditrichaeota bacterium]|nr:DUF1926 domain-containing protein [Calditrichota bacterium]
MKTVTLVFGVHDHQPVGNFDFVFEDAYQRAYLPFLDVLEAHPRIRLAMHYSGILFEWILEHHPDYVNRLRKMVRSGQVEMMTGAYYEPILISIPDADKKGQILKLTKTLKKQTGYSAKGLWLAERIWEPHLPKVLKEAGVTYTIVDDSHFKYAGLREEELTGYYVTEEQGTTLNIFPISEKLRYAIPFKEVDVTMDFLRSLATEDGSKMAIFADDGEKFGVWPGTYDHVYEKGWLDAFFTELEKNLDWIRMIHFSEAVDQIKPLGRVYLPTASYREMMEWALPAQATRDLEDFEDVLKLQNLFEPYGIFVRGGFWRNFLAKYPESNNMHKKMLYVSEKVWRAKDALSKSDSKKALDQLWAGQCNCPYWHGVFGGLYLAHLRFAIYRNLIRAEVLADRVLSSAETIRVLKRDFDGNGYDELLVETPLANLYFDPQIGGQLFEYDLRQKAINLLDTMSRHEEAYHRKLTEAAQNSPSDSGDEVASIHDLVVTKEEGLEKLLNYDWYKHHSLIDHFFNPNTTVEQLMAVKYGEDGDFVNQPYTVRTQHKDGKLLVVLTRDGGVWVEGVLTPVRVQKKIWVAADQSVLDVTYSIENKSDRTVPLFFGVEWNFALMAGKSPDRYYEIPGVTLEENFLASVGETPEVSELWLKDEWLKLGIQFLFDQPATLWRFPIETVSLSEAGFEKVYQSSAVVPTWRFELKPGQKKSLHFVNKIVSL